jgi:membrane-associated phospholipid phosphatase
MTASATSPATRKDRSQSRYARYVPSWLTPRVLTYVRWTAIAVWAGFFGNYIADNGIPYLRSDLLMWLAIGLVAASIGKRNVLFVLLDFVPLAAVLVVYDYLRGLSDSLGMPTWWHPQVDLDRLLFFGHEPTVWLQERLKYPSVQWWDVLVALCYISFFFLPYVTAAVLWLRSRRDFYRWSLRFVALSFIAFAFFALTPAAPPWAASQCLPSEIADHPYDPPCMYYDPQYVHNGGLLGPMTTHVPGTNPWVERIATRGLGPLHLHFAQQVIDTGRISVDAVAAIPSLHAGGILLFSIFMWRRVSKWWRPILVLYPLFMAFTLVYTAEHFVTDVLAGWLGAVLVCLVADRLERRRKRRPTTDTLEAPTEQNVENPCPPTNQPPSTPPGAMTPSST